MKRDWKCKLTSRKLWAAVIGVALSVMVIFGVNEIKQEQIVGLITAISTLVAYIIGEGIIDVKNSDSNKDKIAEKCKETNKKDE